MAGFRRRPRRGECAGAPEAPGPAQTAYGEVNVRAPAVDVPGCPVAEVVGLAREIWDEVLAADPPANSAAARELYEDLRARNHVFAQEFPAVLRWAVELRQFDLRVFERFLRSPHLKAFYADRHEFMAAQGEYLNMLYKHRNPRAGEKELQRYRAAVSKSLKDDDALFTEAREEADRAVVDQDAAADQARRARLHAQLCALQAARRTARSGSSGTTESEAATGAAPA